MRKIISLIVAATFCVSTAFAQANLSAADMASLKAKLNANMQADTACQTVTASCLDKHGLINAKDSAGLFEVSRDALAAAAKATSAGALATTVAGTGLSIGAVAIATAAIGLGIALSNSGGGTGTTGSTGTIQN